MSRLGSLCLQEKIQFSSLAQSIRTNSRLKRLQIEFRRGFNKDRDCSNLQTTFRGDHDRVMTLRGVAEVLPALTDIDAPCSLFLLYHGVAIRPTLRLHDINADLQYMFAAIFAAAPAARYFLPRWVSDVPCGRAIDFGFQISLGTSHRRARETCLLLCFIGVGLNQVGRSWLLLKVKAHYIAEQLDRAPYDVIVAKKAEIQALRCSPWMHLG